MTRDAIPDDVAVLIRRAAAAMPTQAWDLRAVRESARRRGRRRLAGWLAGCVAVATAGGAVAVGVGSDNHRPASDAVVLWAQAADVNHLYALMADCPWAGCGVRLLGSDDAGVTWSERTDRVSGPAVLGPTALYVRYRHPEPVQLVAQQKPESVEIDDQQMPPAVSTDGGRTWSGIAPTGPWTAVPEAAVFSCYRAPESSSCTPVAVDPATRRMGALPAPAGFRVTDVRPAQGQLWLTGAVDERGNTATAGAVSRDDGRTWRVVAHPCGCFDSGRVFPAPDGRTAYWAPDLLEDGGGLVVYRSSDRGETWQRLHVTRAVTVLGQTEVQSVVASDGALILVTLDSAGTVTSTWEVMRGGAGPRAVELVGFPASLRPSALRATPLISTPAAGYTAIPAEGGRLYRSVDGRHWVPIDIA